MLHHLIRRPPAFSRNGPQREQAANRRGAFTRSPDILPRHDTASILFDNARSDSTLSSDARVTRIQRFIAQRKPRFAPAAKGGCLLRPLVRAMNDSPQDPPRITR